MVQGELPLPDVKIESHESVPGTLFYNEDREGTSVTENAIVVTGELPLPKEFVVHESEIAPLMEPVKHESVFVGSLFDDGRESALLFENAHVELGELPMPGEYVRHQSEMASFKNLALGMSDFMDTALLDEVL